MPGRWEYEVGKLYEKQLMKQLIKLGYFVMRAPGSGRGQSKIFYPDIVAIRNGQVYFIEVKVRSDNRPIHLEREKYHKYMYIAKLAGATCYLCVWYKSIGSFRCRMLTNYDYATVRYFVYTYSRFKDDKLRVYEVFK